jgi:hypothetical protein
MTDNTLMPLFIFGLFGMTTIGIIRKFCGYLNNRTHIKKLAHELDPMNTDLEQKLLIPGSRTVVVDLEEADRVLEQREQAASSFRLETLATELDTSRHQGPDILYSYGSAETFNIGLDGSQKDLRTPRTQTESPDTEEILTFEETAQRGNSCDPKSPHP